MQKTILLLILAVSVVYAVPHPPATTPAPAVAVRGGYDSRFDQIDLDEVLNQERLLRSYIRCLESTGPCTPDARMLKEILPDAVSTDCMKCTEKQKSGANKVTRFLIDNRPEDWERLEKIYDPEGTYRRTYLEEKKLTEGKTKDTEQNSGIQA